MRRSKGENSGGACWLKRPLTGTGASSRFSQERTYTRTMLRLWKRPSCGYTTTTLLWWTAVQLGAKSGGCCCCLCNWRKRNTTGLKKNFAPHFPPRCHPLFFFSAVYFYTWWFRARSNCSCSVFIPLHTINTYWSQSTSCRKEPEVEACPFPLTYNLHLYILLHDWTM